jgi:hypothetical protein
MMSREYHVVAIRHDGIEFHHRYGILMNTAILAFNISHRIGSAFAGISKNKR